MGGGKDDEGADDEMFDAALEKRRKHRREMKNNTHNKLGKLVGVATRLEFVEEELAKVADVKAPEAKLLTRAEWEVIKQRSAEKGQKAQEEAKREYEERKAKRDHQAQARIEKQITKRATVVKNLDHATGGGGLELCIDMRSRYRYRYPTQHHQAGCSLDGTEAPEGTAHDCQ